MKNRREFLGGCAAAATLMAMPAAAARLSSAPVEDAEFERFRELQGERVALREGGSVVVSRVEAVKVDRRLDQCLVRMVPSSEMDSGIYHLQTAAGTRALYLEAGGSVRRPTLTAAVSSLRV